MKTKQPTFELDEDSKFMIIDGILHSVLKHHSFDDFGAIMDTFTVINFYLICGMIESWEDEINNILYFGNFLLCC